MPIPFFVAAGAGLFAGAVGAAGHSMAKETNQKAEWVVEDAQKLYETEKSKLEDAEAKMNSAVMNLGNTKKDILCGSFMDFYDSYSKVKVNFQLKKTAGIDEVLTIDEPDMVRLHGMSDLLSSQLSGAAAGAATGVVIGLAMSGTLSLVAGSTALAVSSVGLVGTGLAGTALGLAGSGLALGVSMTPASVILGPAVFVSGISSSMKADENLEKARAYSAEVDVAVEKMKTSKTLCNAIAKRSDMMNGLLKDLERVFKPCAKKMNIIVQEKALATGKQHLDENDLTDEEIELIAATRALAGAIKAVLDVPIVNKNNTDVTRKSKDIHTDINKALPTLTEDAQSALYAI